MKIFISWSGPQSRAIAEALSGWLRLTIQAVAPFYSPEMEKGINWSTEIDNSLEGTRFGIVCLTPENLESRWIHYEAGALSKTGDLSKRGEARIWTFLFNLKPSDVPPPLSRFQHTTTDKGEVFKLLKSINSHLNDVGVSPLQENILKVSFETYWPRLETSLNGVRLMSRIAESNVGRSDREVLDEILELLRHQAKLLAISTDQLAYIHGLDQQTDKAETQMHGTDEDIPF
ncbi:MAG: toll/interleukin-1 receptor domain-containing protein [Acidobacteria bacterium]|nr:toll/interleukin-1 receptor domain-containing protein [Acidobacteriota bacterium]